MKIVKGETAFKDDEVYFEKSVKYIQNEDGSSNDPEGAQELFISEEDAGGGKYFVIETKRWAFDSVEDFIEILKHFKK